VKNTSLAIKIALAFAALYIIWGTTYLVIVIGLEDFPPFFLAALRFTIAGFLLIGYCFYKRDDVPTTAAILKNSLLGIIILSGGQGILIWAEQYIASGYAAILVATLPIWYVLIDKKQWSVCFSNPYIVTGILIGFLGILLLFKDHLLTPTISEKEQMGLLASLGVLFSAICWVSGSLYYRYRPTKGTIFSNLGWQLLGAAVFSFVLSFFLGELTNFTFARVSWESWSAVFYLAIGGSIVAFVSYTWLLTKKPSAVVGTYAYINPVIAVFIGWLWADEIIALHQLIGMVIILISAAIVNLSKYKVLQAPKS